MGNRNRIITAAFAVASLVLMASTASAQGVMYVKNSKVGIGDDNPTGTPLTLKTADGSGSGFKVETTGAVNNKLWVFAQNASTGAFLISNFVGGNAQMQIFPNVGGNNPANTFVVRNGGIGVGTQGPAANTLDVAAGKLTLADAWTQRSSKRYKDDIRPLDGALDKVQKLQGVSYTMKSTGQGSIGFIAEDAGQVVPEIVSFEDNGVDAIGMDYARVSALLVEAVKSQQKQIEELQLQLAEQQR